RDLSTPRFGLSRAELCSCAALEMTDGAMDADVNGMPQLVIRVSAVKPILAATSRRIYFSATRAYLGRPAVRPGMPRLYGRRSSSKSTGVVANSFLRRPSFDM